MSITRTLLVALAVVALAAPASSQAAPIDMHASVALSSAGAQKQDLRAPAERPSVTDDGGDWTAIGLVTGGVLVLSALAAFTSRRIRHAQQIRATAAYRLRPGCRPCGRHPTRGCLTT